MKIIFKFLPSVRRWLEYDAYYNNVIFALSTNNSAT